MTLYEELVDHVSHRVELVQHRVGPVPYITIRCLDCDCQVEVA